MFANVIIKLHFLNFLPQIFNHHFFFFLRAIGPVNKKLMWELVLAIGLIFFSRSFQFLNYTFSLLLNYIHIFSSWIYIVHTFEPVSWGPWQQRKVTGSCLWYRTSKSAFEMWYWEYTTENSHAQVCAISGASLILLQSKYFTHVF